MEEVRGDNSFGIFKMVEGIKIGIFMHCFVNCFSRFFRTQGSSIDLRGHAKTRRELEAKICVLLRRMILNAMFRDVVWGTRISVELGSHFLLLPFPQQKSIASVFPL